jgi:hypothetical protein
VEINRDVSIWIGVVLNLSVVACSGSRLMFCSLSLGWKNHLLLFVVSSEFAMLWVEHLTDNACVVTVTLCFSLYCLSKLGTILKNGSVFLQFGHWFGGRFSGWFGGRFSGPVMCFLFRCIDLYQLDWFIAVMPLLHLSPFGVGYSTLWKNLLMSWLICGLVVGDVDCMFGVMDD